MAKHVTATKGKKSVSAAIKLAAEDSAKAAVPNPAKIALTDVRVQDFRGLRDLCTKLDLMTVLIGENNAGKTSFLQALAIVFGPSRASHDDFYVAADGMRSERSRCTADPCNTY